MAKFRVVVLESQYYEVHVEADDAIEASEIAEEVYGSQGTIFHTSVGMVQSEREE